MLQSKFGQPCDARLNDRCSSVNKWYTSIPCPGSPGFCPKCLPQNEPSTTSPCKTRTDGRTITATDHNGHQCCLQENLCINYNCGNGNCTQITKPCYDSISQICPRSTSENKLLSDSCVHDPTKRAELLKDGCTENNLAAWGRGFCDQLPPEGITPSGYSCCDCEMGWKGPECDVPTCSVDCQNGGLCNDKSLQCDCKIKTSGDTTIGWYGNDCSKPIHPCNQLGICGENANCVEFKDTNGMYNYECQCNNDYTKEGTNLQKQCTVLLPGECRKSQIGCSVNTNCMGPGTPGCEKACYVIPETRKWDTNCAMWHGEMELSGPGPVHDSKKRGCTCKRDYHDPVHAPLFKFSPTYDPHWYNSVGGCNEKDLCPPFYEPKHPNNIKESF
jgi:hypothetical protein